MSNSKKSWNAGKAQRRAGEANKKSLKISAQEARGGKKKRS